MNRPILRALAATVALAPFAAWTTGSAIAQLPPLLPTTTTTLPGSSTSGPTTTAPSPTTIPNPVTTTTEPADEEGGEEEPPVTVPVETEESPDLVPLPGGDGAPPLDAIDELGIPPWALDQMRSVRRSGGNGTKQLLELLSPLLSFGFTPEEVAKIGIGKFPIAGEATFGDDWWYPRFTPEFHLHEGTDIFAAFGTPVLAPFDGVVTMGEGRVGGLYTYLTVEDRTFYYFAHLEALPQLPDDQRLTDPAEVATYAFREFDQPVAYRVKAGDVIGTVGDTGNAKGGSPHLHFEVHPGGGEATNPKPILDQWLTEAEDAADDVIALYTSRGPKAVLSTQRTRAAGPGQFAAPSRPLSPEILGVSSVGPGTGVQIVTEEVVRAVARIDWDQHRAALARPMRELSALLAPALGEVSPGS